MASCQNNSSYRVKPAQTVLLSAPNARSYSQSHSPYPASTPKGVADIILDNEPLEEACGTWFFGQPETLELMETSDSDFEILAVPHNESYVEARQPAGHSCTTTEDLNFDSDDSSCSLAA